MRVIDTSAWIEWITGSLVGEQVAALLPPIDQWLVPTIVQFELAKWLAREQADRVRTAEVIAFSNVRVTAPLTTSIAIRAAAIGKAHGLAVADAIIFATAVEFGADLVTCDAHFRDLPGVIFIPKSPR